MPLCCVSWLEMMISLKSSEVKSDLEYNGCLNSKLLSDLRPTTIGCNFNWSKQNLWYFDTWYTSCSLSMELHPNSIHTQLTLTTVLRYGSSINTIISTFIMSLGFRTIHPHFLLFRLIPISRTEDDALLHS